MPEKPWILADSTLRGQRFIHPCIEKTLDFVKMDSGRTEIKQRRQQSGEQDRAVYSQEAKSNRTDSEGTGGSARCDE